jgi:hypothetical protein
MTGGYPAERAAEIRLHQTQLIGVAGDVKREAAPRSNERVSGAAESPRHGVRIVTLR